jgi:hypothetical protein
MDFENEVDILLLMKVLFYFVSHIEISHNAHHYASGSAGKPWMS